MPGQIELREVPIDARSSRLLEQAQKMQHVLKQ